MAAAVAVAMGGGAAGGWRAAAAHKTWSSFFCYRPLFHIHARAIMSAIMGRAYRGEGETKGNYRRAASTHGELVVMLAHKKTSTWLNTHVNTPRRATRALSRDESAR